MLGENAMCQSSQGWKSKCVYLQASKGNKPWDKSVPASFSLSEPAEPGLLPHAFSLSLLCLILSRIKHPEKNPTYFMKSPSLSVSQKH